MISIKNVRATVHPRENRDIYIYIYIEREREKESTSSVAEKNNLPMMRMLRRRPEMRPVAGINERINEIIIKTGMPSGSIRFEDSPQVEKNGMQGRPNSIS